MIMLPSLKSSPWIIRVFTVDLNELIKHTSSKIEVLVPKMFPQNQKDLPQLIR